MNTILHSQILGEGTPFIILHGFLGMGDNWKTLGKKFAEAGYQVHLVDQRNHGRSFHSPDFSYELMARDMKAYVDHHQLKNFILLGHSMGGKTAMYFAADHPADVSRLIIADIGPKAYPLHHQDILKALNSLNFSELKSRGEADKVLSDYIKDEGTKQFLLKNLYWQEKGRLGLRINLPVLTATIDEVGKELPLHAMVTVPTLFIRGADSGYIEDVDLLGIQHQFREVAFATLPNAGHWLHADNPSQFLDQVLGFIRIGEI